MNDLDSANEKLNHSANTYEPVTLSRYECDELIQEYNDDQEQLDAFERMESRFDLLLIFLYFYGFYLLSQWIGAPERILHVVCSMDPDVCHILAMQVQ